MILILIAFVLLATDLVQAQSGSYDIQLKWIDKSNNEEGFNIIRDKVKIATVGKDVTTYIDSVAGTPGQQFCYEVSAFNHEFTDGTGKLIESAPTNSSCIKIPVVIVSPPNAPSGLSTAGISTSSIRLSWAKNSDNEANFQAERKGFQPPSVTLLTMPKDVPNFDDSGLTRNRTYCYRVRAQNVAGDSAFSNESCATTSR